MHARISEVNISGPDQYLVTFVLILLHKHFDACVLGKIINGKVSKSESLDSKCGRLMCESESLLNSHSIKENP